MATKTLDSNSKRKAEEDGKKEAEITGDELLSSIVTKRKKIQTSGSYKKPKPSKKTEDSSRKVGDSNENAKTSKKTEDSSRKLDESKKKVKKADKKVNSESPVKRPGKEDEAEVKKVKKSKIKKVEAVEENENGADYVFPMNRVTRIVKSENSDVKLSAEAAFLFNKASVWC